MIAVAPNGAGKQVEQLEARIAHLEQALAATRRTEGETTALAAWPIACLTAAGDVLDATATAMAALDAITDPALPRPVRRLDETAILALCAALPEPGRTGQAVLFRRDGILSHFTVLVRLMGGEQDDLLTVLFLEMEMASGSYVDPLWLGILFGAQAPTRSARPDGAI